MRLDPRVSLTPLPRRTAPLARRHGEVHLFQSDAIGIGNWSCAGHDSTHEELSTAHQVVVARHGVFEREARGVRTIADATSASLWNADEPYRVRHPLPGGDECSFFVVPVDGVRELLADVDPGALDADTPSFPVTRVPLDGETYLLHRLAVHAALSTDGVPLLIEELGIEFLHRAVAGRDTKGGRAGSAARSRSAPMYAARVREVIAARYREPLTLAQLAREVSCSPYHLSRMVTAVEGVPIHRLIVRLRLRDALERLLETCDHLSAIAIECGFSSHSHFTDAFRREFGTTPSRIRKLTSTGARALQRRGGTR